MNEILIKMNLQATKVWDVIKYYKPYLLKFTLEFTINFTNFSAIKKLTKVNLLLFGSKMPIVYLKNEIEKCIERGIDQFDFRLSEGHVRDLCA